MRHGRSFPIKPHLPPAIVGAPVVVWLAPPSIVISQQARNLAARIASGRRLRPRLPPAIIGAAPPPPAGPIVTRAYMVGQAIVRARRMAGDVGPLNISAPPIVSASSARTPLKGTLITIRAGITL